MTNHYNPMYPNGYPQRVKAVSPQSRFAIAPADLNLLLTAAKNGAMVGAAGAGAAQLHQLQQRNITWQQALNGTVEGALKAGAATAAATAVGHLVKNNSALSMVATLATGTAVMYALTKPAKNKK